MQTKPVFLLLVFSCFLGSAELHAQLSNPVGKWRILTHVMFLPDALDKGEAWVDSNLLPVGFEASIQIDSNGRFVWQTPESTRTGKWQLKRRNQRFIMHFDDGERVMLGGRGQVNFYQPLILPEKFEKLYKTLGIRPSFGESTYERVLDAKDSLARQALTGNWRITHRQLDNKKKVFESPWIYVIPPHDSLPARKVVGKWHNTDTTRKGDDAYAKNLWHPYRSTYKLEKWGADQWVLVGYAGKKVEVLFLEPIQPST